MPQKIAILVAVAALAYIGLCAALFFLQRSLLYFPHLPTGGSAATTLTLQVDGHQVLVAARPHKGPKALVYFGGNAEDVSFNLPDFSAAFPDHAIYLLHYRGYGGSSGTPTEAALFADALALYDKVRGEHESIVAIGRSLGSGVAVHLSSVRPVARLVLVTPYDSIQEVAAVHYPYVPVRWLLRDRFESSRYAAQVTVPTLLLAADRDEVIPRARTEALHRSFRPGVATLKVLPRTSHNTISESPEYLPLLKGAP